MMSSTGNPLASSDDDDDDVVSQHDGEEDNELNPVGVVPTVGMEFASHDEALQFYKTYAYTTGFPVRIRTSKKGDDGLIRYVIYACGREGKRPTGTGSSLNPRPTMQTGCEAKISVSVDMWGKWHVTKVHLDHNHRTSPSKSRLYRCNRQIDENVKRKLEVNDIAGIPLHKTFNSAVVEAGGYDHLTFVEKDCRNYIDKVRRLRLGEGDAAAIQAYFSKMQAQCPGFFFSLDLDDDSRLRNVFWADKRCREAYKEFGDVVTFDTTYLTNRYDMPFAPFVGVNHHGQSTLLGCGLLSSEDTKSFIWLFQTWLQCMEFVPPAGIITDQDRAMQNAIQIVFPTTRHRWCLWHILKKLPEKFGYHDQKGSILLAVHDSVYESQIPEDFESCWGAMIEKYKLQDNEWLSGLYRERARWVPCYLKMTFWAGMSTTQRSESMNAFFDGYVQSKTSLKQFVEQYEQALRCKVEKEFQEDFRSYAQMIPCATRFSIEKQFQEVYTLRKFKEFQEEITGKVYCDVVSAENEASRTRYLVREDIIFDEVEKRKSYNVLHDRESCYIECSCHLFEFRGILCRHALSVLHRNQVKLLPDRYILRRWRRDVCRTYTRVKINYAGWVSTVEQTRYDQLCNLFAKVANVVVDDEVRTKELIQWLQAQLNDHSTSRPRITYNKDLVSQDSAQIAFASVELEKTSLPPILDPKCTRRKGAPKKLRQKGPLERVAKKAKVNKKKSKGKTLEDVDVHDSQPIVQSSQETHFGMPTTLSFSQLLMQQPSFQPCNDAIEINCLPTFGLEQPFMQNHPLSQALEGDLNGMLPLEVGDIGNYQQ